MLIHVIGFDKTLVFWSIDFGNVQRCLWDLLVRVSASYNFFIVAYQV